MEAPELDEGQRARACKLTEELKQMYPTFKDVLAYGWTLDYHAEIDAAGLFIAEMRQKAKAR